MFTKEVQNKLQYYVYRLIDPRDGQTFYIGKGKGNRIFAHENNALKNYGGESFVDKNEDEISTKTQQIRDIHLAGLTVIHIIQRYGLTEKEAFEVEAALLDCFPGLTNLQNGHGNDRGVNHAEVLQRELSYEKFKDVEGLKYIILKTSEEMINMRDGKIYEAIRKYWNVNIDRANQCKYALGAVNGIVRNVYEIDDWHLTSNKEYCGRYEFVGKEASDEIKELFINKRLPSNYTKKGMASSLLYHD